MPINVKLTHRTLASLKLPTKTSALTAYAQGIVMAMTSNPEFPNPVPSLATVAGKTWVATPSTLQTKTTVAGCPSRRGCSSGTER
jgi:hypothetical protein